MQKVLVFYGGIVYSITMNKENKNKNTEGGMKYSVIWIRSEEHWEDMSTEDRREKLKVVTFTSKNKAIGFKMGVSEDYDVTIVTIGKGVPTKEWLDAIAKQDSV